MQLNILIRGQSNALLFADHAGWAAPSAMQKEVERLLGFDGVSDKVALQVQWGDSTSTVHSGTSFVEEWMAKDGSGQWVAGNLEKSLLGYVAQDMTAEQRANPTAVLWLHSEYDSAIQGLSAADWTAAVRADAALVRNALGQNADSVPYLFVSAHPYWGNDAAHQAIRQGMESLANDSSFNGHIAAQALDLDIDNDDLDGNTSTREYGGPHISSSDAKIIAGRAAKSIAEAFAQYAQPGSPVALANGNIADEGPKVVSAKLSGARTLDIDVLHDGATGFATLDADAAKGLGWSVRGDNGATVRATGVTILDGDTLRVTFGADLPAGGTLHYGYGYGRLASGSSPGQGNAIYDNAGLPIWTPASGVKIGTTSGAGTAPPLTSTPPANTPVSLSAGSGPDALVLKLSQDAWRGDAQFTVKVDGKQIGGTFTASALKASGQTDTLTLKGDWAPGAHKVEVNFLNDDWGGSRATDRNLYVESATFNGTKIDGAALVMEKSGPAGFSFTEAGDPDPVLPPASPGEFGTSVRWGDEFNGSSVDGSKWPILYGGSVYWNGAFRWDNSQVSVSDGNLVIGLDNQADGIWKVGGLSATPSSWAPGFSFTYGKVEIRAKVSEEVWGAGPCFLLWPASNDHWPPEVDILETPKGKGMFTNHWQGPGGNNDDRYESHTFDIDYDQWHVYGVEWTPDRLTMTVDGQVMKTFTTNIPNEPMSIGLQGHVGSATDGWYGSPNGSGTNSVDVFVDYVRVYDYIG